MHTLNAHRRASRLGIDLLYRSSGCDAIIYDIVQTYKRVRWIAGQPGCSIIKQSHCKVTPNMSEHAQLPDS